LLTNEEKELRESELLYSPKFQVLALQNELLLMMDTAASNV
jgi:hypothetical protein